MTHLEKATRIYQVSALMILTTVLLFVLLNLACLFTRPLWRHSEEVAPTRFYSAEEIAKLYGTLDGDEFVRLMEETWSRPVVYESYTHFKEDAFVGRYVNVHTNGFRLSRNQGPWPPERTRFNIFVFGGSTTFGYGVPDGETIPSALQEILSKALNTDVRVYNFGRAFYQSIQERILFEQLLLAGAVPHLALFVDGLNDMFFAEGEPYSAKVTAQLMGGKLLREHRYDLLRSLPVIEAFDAVAGRRPANAPLGENHPIDPRQPPTDEFKSLLDAACQRYLNNKELIERIATAYGVKSCFIWQPVPTYKYDLNYHLFRGEGISWRSRPGYERMAELIRIKPAGTNFLWCADMQQGFQEPLYVDAVHYSPKMCDLVARQIAKLLLERQLLR